MEEVEKIREYLKDLVLVMANRAEKEVDAIMPGYTQISTIASPTRPMVTSAPLPRTRLLRRSQPTIPTHPPNLHPPPRLRRTSRQPVLHRPRVPPTTTRIRLTRRELDAYRARPRFRYRVPAVVEFDDDSHVQDGGRLYHLLYRRVRIHPTERCLQVRQ
jgi:hypothetical protein